jgi:transcriptional regulator with XRE-family HTH domain
MKEEHVPLIDYIKSIAPTEELVSKNKIQFGKLLRQWRLKMNWTQYCAGKYAESLGFETISYGNLSVLERGVAGELRYKAYYQLARLNYSLYCKEYEPLKIKDPVLRNKIKTIGVVAITDREQQPWGVLEFFAAANDAIEFPWDVDAEEKRLADEEAAMRLSTGNVQSEQQAFMRLNEKAFSLAGDSIICKKKTITVRELEALNFLSKYAKSAYKLIDVPLEVIGRRQSP